MKNQDQERFWSKVNKTHTCWLWIGGMKTAGYGEFNYEGRSERSHRVAYTLIKGQIPHGLEIDHLCRVRNCVNPAHLEAVSKRENTLRGIGPSADNSLKTYCLHGHHFSGENLYINPKGHRACRICKNNWQKQYAIRRDTPGFKARRTWKSGPYKYVMVKR